MGIINISFHQASHWENLDFAMNSTENFLTTLLANATITISTPTQILNDNYGLTESDIHIIIIVFSVLLGLGIIITTVLLIKKCCLKQKSAEISTEKDKIGAVNIGGVLHDTDNWSEIQLDTL